MISPSSRSAILGSMSLTETRSASPPSETSLRTSTIGSGKLWSRAKSRAIGSCRDGRKIFLQLCLQVDRLANRRLAEARIELVDLRGVHPARRQRADRLRLKAGVDEVR